MNDHRDRDASLERLLELGARESGLGARPVGSECLDAEMLAAWSDGSLRGAERAAAERHAAGCARCQATLAAMIRTEPPPPVRAGWRRGATLRWAVPLTAAAVAVVVWVLTRHVDRVTVPESATFEAVAPESAAPRTAAPAATPERFDARELESKPLDSTAPRTSADTSATRRLAVPSAAGGAERDQRAAKESSDAEQRRREATAPPAQGATAAARLEARRVAVAPPAAAPRTAPAERVAESRAAQQSLSPIDALSPDPSIRWRVGALGLLQRSTDGGATWQTHSIGVTADLLAASAPSPSICWVVGRQGTVLLTVDGYTWRRLTFPEAADLVAVTARSGDVADVTAADGRVFRTTDGGRAWRGR